MTPCRTIPMEFSSRHRVQAWATGSKATRLFHREARLIFDRLKLSATKLHLLLASHFQTLGSAGSSGMPLTRLGFAGRAIRSLAHSGKASDQWPVWPSCSESDTSFSNQKRAPHANQFLVESEIRQQPLTTKNPYGKDPHVLESPQKTERASLLGSPTHPSSQASHVR